MQLRSSMLSLVLALGLAAATPVQAQEPTPSHLAAARELVHVSGAYSTLEGVLPEIVQEIKRQAVTRPDLVKDMNEVLVGLQAEIDKQRDLGVSETARVYAKYLTEPEIKEVVAFFKTPAGAKYIKVQPEVTDDLVSAITAWSQQAGEYVQTRVRAEMGKRGHQMQ